MSGAPGAGKTLLARSLPSILPAMTLPEALDVTRIYSVADVLPPETPLIRHRPFRAPHHTISNAGLVGGGHWPRPGEISLAHRGVLFLDELPEFGQHTWRCCASRSKTRSSPSAARRAADLPGQLHAGRRHESVSVRLFRRLRALVHVQHDARQPLPEAHLRAAARPHRHPRRGAARAVPEVEQRPPGRAIRSHPGAGRGGACAADRTVRAEAGASSKSTRPAIGLTCNADMGPDAGARLLPDR